MTSERSIDSGFEPLTSVEDPEPPQTGHPPVPPPLFRGEELRCQVELPLPHRRQIDAAEQAGGPGAETAPGRQNAGGGEVDDPGAAFRVDQDVVPLSPVEMDHAAGVHGADQTIEPAEHRGDPLPPSLAPAGDPLAAHRLDEKAVSSPPPVAGRHPGVPSQARQGADLPRDLEPPHKAGRP